MSFICKDNTFFWNKNKFGYFLLWFVFSFCYHHLQILSSFSWLLTVSRPLLYILNSLFCLEKKILIANSTSLILLWWPLWYILLWYLQTHMMLCLFIGSVWSMYIYNGFNHTDFLFKAKHLNLLYWLCGSSKFISCNHVSWQWVCIVCFTLSDFCCSIWLIFM